MRDVAVVRAPSNLGLRPLRLGHEPGTWRAPAALCAAGLLDAVSSTEVIDLPRPPYSSEAQDGTRLRNGPAMREHNLLLAGVVDSLIRQERWPLVAGGDCSVLLGALAGVRRSTPISLVHIDGHSDFRHPGNYNPESTLGAVAGMDLALATGRGEALMTDWPGVAGPLVPDAQVIQIGERENLDPDYAWPDIADTEITSVDVRTALQRGPAWVVNTIRSTLDREPAWPFWVHLDVDVLDQAIMPAVDSPGSPGLEPDALVTMLRSLLGDVRCVGMTVTVFDPDLDASGECASLIVKILRDSFVIR